MKISQSDSSAWNLVFVLYTCAAFVIVASYLLVHLMGYGFFFFTPGGLALGMRSLNFPILILFLLGFMAPIPLGAGSVFFFLWIVYSVCFLFAWKWRRGFHVVVAKRASTGLRDVFSNFLFAMPLLSSMVLTAALAIIYSQGIVGIETGVPQLSPDPHEAFLDLAYAPFIEELAFRLVPIGLVVVFYVFLLGKNVRGVSAVGNRFKLFFMVFLYPEGAKKMVGLPNVDEDGVSRGVSLLEWVMVFVTSLVFGLAHVLSPVGWEIGKVTSTFVQGFFFAVTYVIYGFQAPILLHWYFNYYFYFFDLSVVEGFFPTTIGLLSVIEIIILLVGVFGWVAFAVVGVRKFVRFRREQPRQPQLPLFTDPSQSV